MVGNLQLYALFTPVSCWQQACPLNGRIALSSIDTRTSTSHYSLVQPHIPAQFPAVITLSNGVCKAILPSRFNIQTDT